MNSKQTYLAWVRTHYPSLYFKAINQVFGNKAGLGGLGDDLTDSVANFSPDLSAVGVDTPDVSSDTANSINAAYDTVQSTSSGGTDWWSALANAVTQIAPTVVQTQAAENLLALNTQRAKQGLPLYTSNGQVVTNSMLSPTSQTMARLESALSGGGMMWPLLALGGGLLLWAIAKR